MPFTLAHPAAVVPIARVLKRRVSLSALLAGSVAPDFDHIPQLPSFGISSHSLLGAFTFCLPLGLILYLAFHGIFKRPLIDLLPSGWASRVETLDAAGVRWPQIPAWSVVVSLLVRTATHLVWDSFTHPGSVADRIPILNLVLFNFADVQVPVFSILQHMSTVLGMAVMVWWLRRWYRETPGRPVRASLTAVHRVIAIVVILGVTSAIALAFGAAAAVDATPTREFRAFLFGAALGWFCGLGIALLAFTTWWYRCARPS